MGGRLGDVKTRATEAAEGGEGGCRVHKGYFAQSSQRAETLLTRRCLRGGGPRCARHGSRGARITNAAAHIAFVNPSVSRSMCRPKAGTHRRTSTLPSVNSV